MIYATRAFTFLVRAFGATDSTRFDVHTGSGKAGEGISRPRHQFLGEVHQEFMFAQNVEA
jgi:hypothetical protein